MNRELEEKARALAGMKGYVTNLRACPDGTPVTAEFVIGAYHQLFQIEKSFRMAKSDLQARPIYHRTRDSIEAHLTIVFAALAVSRWIEHQTGWSIRKFVKTARRYRTIQIQAGPHTITAADPLPDDLRQAIDAINHANRLRTKLSQLGIYADTGAGAPAGGCSGPSIPGPPRMLGAGLESSRVVRAERPRQFALRRPSPSTAVRRFRWRPRPACSAPPACPAGG